MRLITKISDFVRSLTSNEANTDAPDGVRVPPPEDGPVPRPDREPMQEPRPDRD
jgi:hypothetical protein